MFGFRDRRRKRLRSKPFPEAWAHILVTKLPYYARLPLEDQAELHGHIQVFLAEKYFEGCAGLELTDEIRLLIAAQACILLLHRETDYYPGLRSILVYPDTYIAQGKRALPGGVVTEFAGPRAGESWHQPGANSVAGGGPVVLSWKAVLAGAASADDGRNVVFHEFAHQLDGESGSVEGVPALDRRSGYPKWASVFGAGYEAHLEDLRAQRPTLLGSYAASSPAEFFAVLTERFFERGGELKAKHPQMYRLLAEYYRQDPAAVWAG